MEEKNKYYVKVCDDTGYETASYFCKMTEEQANTITNFLKMVKDGTYYIQEVDENVYFEI